MTFTNFLRGTVAAASLLVAGSAIAADLPSRKAAAAPAPVMIDAFQPFQIRLRATAIIPDGKSTIYDKFGLLTGVGSSGVNTPIWGAGAKVSTTVIPELDISYYLTKNIAIEAICCFSKHKITGTGSIAGLDIGSKWVFPPTVLLQYHFTNFGAFQPYIGVGVNYTAFFGGKSGGNWAPYWSGIGFTGFNAITNLSVGSSFGVAGQIGFDYMLNQNWGVNVDVKRIMMQPTAHALVWNNLANAIIPVRAKVNIDPWVVSAGLTYRFGGSAGPVVAKY